jgi:hypothetical protein
MLSSDIEAAFTPPSPGFAATASYDHGAWTALLRAHLRDAGAPPTRLAYGAFSPQDRAALRAYLDGMQLRGVAGLDRAGQFAYWINLYNAQTVAVVLDHYPVASIRDIALGGGVRAAILGGPWQKKLMTVAGIRLSLDDIEHGILRRLFRDPRLHYAINCASMGCPSLGAEAFSADTLEDQLQSAACEFISAPHGVAFEGQSLVLSSIFEWYRKDFGGTDRSLLEHLASHAEALLRERLLQASRIDSYRYDWRLNDHAE